MIPEITDEMGRFWDQPDRSEIEIDDTHALMARDTFAKLADYRRSNPSGVYEGKMWRRGNFLVWYGPSDLPDMCGVNYRKILVVE
jgi:hypothetical protein